MPFAQLMAVLPLRDVACSLRVPSNSNDLKCNKDENETVIAHRSDCGLFLFRQKKGVRQWMSNSKLIELSYYDPSAQVRLSAYADTLVLDHDQNGSIISAIRFGGYPEMVRAMADAIYGGATIEAAQNDTTRMLQSSLKSYQRQITHDGIYAVATLMAADTVQEDDRSGKHEKDEDTNLVDTEQMELQPRRCYIFCPARDQKRLFEELDHKTAAPLIPEFQDYVLSSLRQRGDLRQLEVISLKERIDAWVLDLKPQDQNVVEVLERGLQSGDIQIPGAVPNMPDGFENVENVTGYTVPADQFFFQKEHKKNHTCPHCGMPLWSAVNPDKRIDWVKIGEYGWVYRYGAQAHLHRTKNERVLDQLAEIAQNPDAFYPIRGAHRRFPLSTYIKKKLRGRIDGFLCDELHEYNNNSGQGDAMAELYGASRCFVGMTATLINGYSSGIFHLLYRIVPGLMLKDGKRYKSPGDFDAEYGVVENTYEIQDAEYNSNRRTSKRRTKSKQLPGVSPLVFSRFLLEYTAFLSLSDMGKDLPDYEEIPVPLEMPEDVRTAYKEAEHKLQKVLRTDRKAAQKILSTYLNLLTVYPDQPYDQPEVVHPINGMPIVTPKNCGDFSRLLPKEERVLELVRQKAANGERVLIYTSWTRTDSQKKLQKLLCSEGYRTEILTPQIATDKREDWVNKRVKNGLQVLITNPRCVETGLDLNAFTTIIFYSMGYNLFTLRQASRRSWRINQTAPRVEVYMLYYADTMQAKAMKLMASKLAVAGIIEGTFSEEGLAAMSDVKDLTSQMAKELALGIRDNVEDIAAAFRKMAVMNPERKKNIAAAQLKETAAEEQKAPAAKDSFGVRTAQAQVRQALYEGLLARTAEEQKKRKSKKAEVDENQLSIFGFAA